MSDHPKMPELPEELRKNYGPLKALNLRNIHVAKGGEKIAEGGCAGCLMAIIGLIVGGIFCIIPFGFLIGIPILWFSVFLPFAGAAAGLPPTGTVDCPYCGRAQTRVTLQSAGTPNYQKCSHCLERMELPPYIKG